MIFLSLKADLKDNRKHSCRSKSMGYVSVHLYLRCSIIYIISYIIVRCVYINVRAFNLYPEASVLNFAVLNHHHHPHMFIFKWISLQTFLFIFFIFYIPGIWLTGRIHLYVISFSKCLHFQMVSLNITISHLSSNLLLSFSNSVDKDLTVDLAIGLHD